MKISKILKGTTLFISALLAGGAFFFLTSANSIEESNTQSINKLSKDIAAVTAELDALNAEDIAAIGSEPFLGEIAMVGFNFAPRGWALCDGQILPISQNQALFSLLGTTYGGDGRTTFALPDLRGRVAVHAGEGPGLTRHRLGQKFGVERSSVRTTKTRVTSGGNNQVVQDVPDMVDNMQPSLGIYYIISLQGVFPSRS